MRTTSGRLLPAMLLLCAIATVAPQAAQAFNFQDVVKLAKERAAQSYQAPEGTPEFLTDLSYDQFRKIRFHPSASLWRASNSDFQVMLVAPGLYFRNIVTIHVVDAAGVHEVPFRKGDFSWPSESIEKQVPTDLGYAGFKLTYPLNGPNVHNQFLVFAGVSYFRGVGRNQRFGLSARGAAVDTGLAIGEKFPIFTDFWLVRPRPDAQKLRFYALLDGPSLTGAYQFIVDPGDSTTLEVKAALFLRQDIKLLGLAPLTSMFYYGRNTPRPDNKWRGAVHDSNGLLIHASTGEWLWHPLINPPSLKMEYFKANSPKGFGLMQRERDFRVYQDGQARYDKRPSAWVVPRGDWGRGHVVLVKIPTDSETNDNIVAFWTPDKPTQAGDHYTLEYTLGFGGAGMTGELMGTAADTFVGFQPPDRYRFIVDFAGGPLAKLAHDAPVKAVVSGLAGAKILGQHVEWIAPLSKWRLSFLVQAPAGNNLYLRAFLKSGGKTLTETWTYTLPPNNRLD